MGPGGLSGFEGVFLLVVDILKYCAAGTRGVGFFVQAALSRIVCSAVTPDLEVARAIDPFYW